MMDAFARLPRRFALTAMLLLGLAASCLLLSMWREVSMQQQRERTLYAQGVAETVAAQLSDVLALGIPIDRIEGLPAYLVEHRRLDHLASIDLLDASFRILGSSDVDKRDNALAWQRQVKDAGAGANVGGNAMGNGLAPVRSLDGKIQGYIAVVVAWDRRTGSAFFGALMLLVAVLSATAFAAEGLGYAWTCGPVLRERIVASASQGLLREDYTQLISGAARRSWDLRPQRIVHMMRQVVEAEMRLRRLTDSLRRTEPDRRRRAGLDGLWIRAKGCAIFPATALSVCRYVPILEQARWLAVLVGTAAGGLLRLSATAVDEPYRLAWLWACLFSGMAIADPFLIRYAPVLAKRGGSETVSAASSAPLGWSAGRLVLTSCLSITALLFVWALVTITPWLVDTLCSAAAGLSIGALLLACQRAVHVTRRQAPFRMLSSTPHVVWLGLLCGVFWFGPLLVAILMPHWPPSLIASVLAVFAIAAVVLIVRCGGERSPWRGTAAWMRRWPAPRKKADCLAGVGIACILAWLALMLERDGAALALGPAIAMPETLRWGAVGGGILLGEWLAKAVQCTKRGWGGRGRLGAALPILLSGVGCAAAWLAWLLRSAGSAASAQEYVAVEWDATLLTMLGIAAMAAAVWSRLVIIRSSWWSIVSTTAVTLAIVAALASPRFGWMGVQWDGILWTLGAVLLCLSCLGVKAGPSSPGDPMHAD